MLGKFVISAALGRTVFFAAALAHDPKVVMRGEGKPVAVPFHPTTLLLSENENNRIQKPSIGCNIKWK